MKLYTDSNEDENRRKRHINEKQERSIVRTKPRIPLFPTFSR